MRRAVAVRVLLGLALAAGLLACSAERRYRTLSFLFDGVPDPNAPEPAPQVGPGFDPLNLTAEQRAAVAGQRIEVPKMSFHAPVKEKRCDACHILDTSGGGLGGFAGVPELNAPPEELCFRCHSFGPAAIIHGPVARGLCLSCHLPHQSPHEHLLRSSDQGEICGACHEGELFVTEEAHRAYGERACSDCHDPHASDRESLLRGDPVEVEVEVEAEAGPAGPPAPEEEGS